MTGPEHYALAGTLVRAADGMDVEHAQAQIAVAQVHATLALAAATALGVAGGAFAPETKAAGDWRGVILP